MVWMLEQVCLATCLSDCWSALHGNASPPGLRWFISHFGEAGLFWPLFSLEPACGALFLVAAAEYLTCEVPFAIGGFVSRPSGHLLCYFEHSHYSDFDFAHLGLLGDTQPNIACYEALAQIAVIFSAAYSLRIVYIGLRPNLE